ncbi:MAG TPA: small archaeal modifier protein 2 [Methanoculleus sp.]|nr:small archaeal modifier protein 2 [Methanoculleus sp.]
MPQLLLHFVKEGEIVETDYEEGDAYQDVLLRLCVIPDTVILLRDGRSIPEDAPVEGDVITVMATASRG